MLLNLRSEKLDTYKSLFSLFTEASKISGILATPIGLLLVGAYLRLEGAPLPLADASTAVNLIIVVAVYGFCATLVIMVFFTPVATCYVPMKERRRVIKHHPGQCINLRSRRLTKKSHYLMFQAGAYGIFLWFFVTILLFDQLPVWALAILCVLMSVLCAAFSRLRYTLCISIPVCINKRRFLQFKCMVSRQIFYGRLLRAAMTWLWILGIFGILSTLALTYKPHYVVEYEKSAYSLALILILLLHLFLTSARIAIRRVPIALLFILASLCIFYPGYIGAKTLRFMGIGGGVPVIVELKAPTGTSIPKEEQKIVGCLLLNMGGQVIIRPLPAPSLGKCGENASASLYSKPEHISNSPIILSSINLIPASEIHMIQGYVPSSVDWPL